MSNKIKMALITFSCLLLVSCSQGQQPGQDNLNPENQPQSNAPGQQHEEPSPAKGEVIEKDNVSQVDYNEMGKVMVLMYHQFVEKETNEWTRSFENFRKDLQTLYDKGYRPVNLRDYIEGNIDVPAGHTPVIFTFDDGTSGQFNLIEQAGTLVANPRSAVGIMEEFSRTHPDFPLKGTFFINHTGFFHGQGAPQERLKYLVDKGFEIGNHTVNHPNLSKITTWEGIQKEIGGHVKKTQEMLPGYVVDQLALPLGITSKKFPEYVERGEYEGVEYRNKVILLVGSNPAPSPLDKNIDFLQLPRIRAMGHKSVWGDMYYWLDHFDKNPSERYISDGDRETFTVPIKHKDRMDNRYNKNIILLR